MARAAIAGSSARQRLSRERVLQAAIAHADAGGLEALTMRQLAEMLGVAPMALYRHVANKDDLIDAMIDVVFGEIGLPRAARTGRPPCASGRMSLSRCPGTPPLGDRPDGVAEKSRSGEPAPPRRGDRQASGGRLRHRDGCPRLLAAGQLHLRLRPDQDEPPVRAPADVAEVAQDMLEPFPANEYPNLVEFITEHAMKPGYDYGERVRVRPRPDPRRPRERQGLV